MGVRKRRQIIPTLDFHGSFVASSHKDDAAILERNANSFTSEMMPSPRRWKPLRMQKHRQPQTATEATWNTKQTPPVPEGLPQQPTALAATSCRATAPWKTDVASGIRPSYCRRPTHPVVAITPPLRRGWRRSRVPASPTRSS